MADETMLDVALAACPFTAEQGFDALYLEERIEMADAVVALSPLPAMLAEALTALSAERLDVVLGLRYMLALTLRENLGLLPELDRELLAAHAAGRLELLAMHLAHALRHNLAATVIMLLPDWAERPAGAT